MKGFCKLQLVYCLLFWYPPGETWLSWEVLPPRYKYPHASPLAESHLQTPPAGRQKMNSEPAFEQLIPSLGHTWALQEQPGSIRVQLPGMSPGLLWNEHSQALVRMLSPKSAAFSAVQAPLSYPSGFIQLSMNPKISVLQLAQDLTFLLIFDSYPEKSSFSLIMKAALSSGQYGNKNFFHLKQSIFTGHKETTPATEVHLYFNQQK